MVSIDEESKEREAALFLVQQMQTMIEEKNQLAMENEQLHLQTQDLIEDIKKLNSELETYDEYIEETNFNGTTSGKDKQNTISVGKLRSKIDELHDLLYELKQKGIQI